MKDYSRAIIGSLLVICSGAVYYFVINGYCSLEWKSIVDIIVGALVANLTTVVQYYFGSSQGSSNKDEVLARALNGRQ